MNTFPTKPGTKENEMCFTGDGRAWRWQSGKWIDAGDSLKYPEYKMNRDSTFGPSHNPIHPDYR